MAKHRHEEHEEHVDESWLIPYADLLTLLLALFIVLFATSNVDKAKYEAMQDAFKSQIIEGGSSSWSMPVSEPSGDPVDPPDAEAIENQQLEALQQSLQVYLQENGLAVDVQTIIDERGLVISMNNALVFDSGSAEIRPEYGGILTRIGETINKLNNYIRVEGHTDNVPSNSEAFPTNWELSSARATRVLRLFVDQANVDPGKIMAVGYGEFKPVSDNSTAEGRNKNRRVDVIILSSKYNDLEGQHVQ